MVTITTIISMIAISDISIMIDINMVSSILISYHHHHFHWHSSSQSTTSQIVSPNFGGGTAPFYSTGVSVILWHHFVKVQDKAENQKPVDRTFISWTIFNYDCLWTLPWWSIFGPSTLAVSGAPGRESHKTGLGLIKYFGFNIFFSNTR